MKTEEEILAFINPLIAKLDRDILRLQNYNQVTSSWVGGGFSHMERMEENRQRLKNWLESQRDFWLLQVATKGGAPTYQLKYGLGLLLQFQYKQRDCYQTLSTLWQAVF